MAEKDKTPDLEKMPLDVADEVDLSHEVKVRLIIHKSENDPKSKKVPVSVNGKTWLIERGIVVDVPLSVFEVLKNAVKDVYSQDKDDIIKREVPSYPFSVL
jgi:hypothetical protein